VEVTEVYQWIVPKARGSGASRPRSVAPSASYRAVSVVAGGSELVRVALTLPFLLCLLRR
jgi:hypothetical protein